MKHITVYHEDGMYAGWPANHGHWQWGDEFLFGFLRGRYVSERDGSYGHKIGRPYEKVLARSMDGGETWNVEVPNVDFESLHISPPPHFYISDNIIRICGVYDTGGDDCNPCGGFYLSNDKGKTWSGAYGFNGDLTELFNGKERHCTSRTCAVGNLIFLSVADRHVWGTDIVFCARWNGEQFNLVSCVSDKIRSVMPSVAIVDGRIVVVIRRRDDNCFVESFVSDDNAKSWRSTGMIDWTGNHNGNPPALIEVDGRLFCTFAHRGLGIIKLSVSNDKGESWTNYILRNAGKSDIGYPRLFKRNDGKLVCVYYWSQEKILDHQHIEATIFDPSEYV